jgi:phosphoglycerate dehydrogenase-like enzyme
MRQPFQVGLTTEYRALVDRHGLDGTGLGDLTGAPGVEWRFLEPDSGELTGGAVEGFDALVIADQRITKSTVDGSQLRLVARFGVGYDNVDVAACTAAGVLVSITPDGVRRPVAAAGLTLLLALTHRVREKDLLVRTGRWSERLAHIGTGLDGRVLGIVGLGNIGGEVARLCRPLGMVHVAHDPYVDPARAAALGVRLVGLDELVAEADAIIITCALTPETRGMVDAGRIARMKPGAVLVNIARGAVVDQDALTEALAGRRIGGAALDVFDLEPLPAGHPLLGLDNVLLTPHGITWTDQLIRGNGASVARAVLAVAAGRVPEHVLNPEALAHPRFAGDRPRA